MKKKKEDNNKQNEQKNINIIKENEKEINILKENNDKNKKDLNKKIEDNVI